MSDLHQTVFANIVLDVLFGIVLLTVSAYGLFRLARFWKVSLLPGAVLLPSLIATGVVLYYPLSPLYVHSDGEFYQQWGFSLAASWITGEPPYSPPPAHAHKWLWPLIIGGITTVAGPVAISLIIFNALAMVFSVVMLQKSTFLLGGSAPRWSMVFIFLSSIPFLLFGPSLLREAVFWLGVASGVLALAYASVERYTPAVLACGLCAATLIGIRPDAGLVLVYGFVSIAILSFGVVGRRRSRLRVATASLSVLVLAVSFPATFELVRAGVTGDTVSESNENLAGEGVATAFKSSAVSKCELESVGGSMATAVVCRAFENMPRALLGPFPWEYEPGAIWLVVGASTLHFLLLVGLAAYHVVRTSGSRWTPIALLGVAALSMVMFSSMLTNYGILVRFRAATEIMLIPLALLGALKLTAKLKPSLVERNIPQKPKGSRNGGN